VSHDIEWTCTDFQSARQTIHECVEHQALLIQALKQQATRITQHCLQSTAKIEASILRHEQREFTTELLASMYRTRDDLYHRIYEYHVEARECLNDVDILCGSDTIVASEIDALYQQRREFLKEADQLELEAQETSSAIQVKRAELDRLL
jgi:hypothetical protein